MRWVILIRNSFCYKLWGHIEYCAMARGWQINGFEFSNLHKAEMEERKKKIEKEKADEELRKELMEMAKKGFKDYNDYLKPY